MRTSRIRLLAVTAATLALVGGAGAVVSAHPGDGDPFGRGAFGLRERIGSLRGIDSDATGLVRRETTYQTDDGLITERLDNATVVSASDGSVEYSLADGQAASVSIDDDTEILALEADTVEIGRRGLMRRHLTSESIEATELAAGSEIIVWAESQADGTFLAERIVVEPVDESETETDTESAEDATASPAPEASAASA